MKLFIRAKANIFISLLFFLLMFSISTANASVRGIGVAGGGESGKCVSGTMGRLVSSPVYGCSWEEGTTDSDRARVRWGAGQKFVREMGYAYVYGFEDGYVPYSDSYGLRMFLCPSEGKGKCTISESMQYFDSVSRVNLISSRKVIEQEPWFMGFVGVVNTGSTACYAYVDSIGTFWKSEGDFFCSDAKTLPLEPAFCYFNMNEDLNINMGALERSDISTIPGTSPHTLKKNVDVLCSGDSAADVKIQFDFLPLSISGMDTINTSATGVGIALRFNGQVVGPTSIFSESYKPGVSSLLLDFEALRDPSQPVNEIPTGGFTAQAIMIVTQQ